MELYTNVHTEHSLRYSTVNIIPRIFRRNICAWTTWTSRWTSEKCL